MTKLQRRAYLREYRKRNRNCECGNPATVPSHGGKICERCARLEYLRDLRASFEQRWMERKQWLFGGMSEHRIVSDGRTVVRHYE